MRLAIRHTLLLATAAAFLAPLGGQVRAQEPSETLEPYQMMRSLQYVQDTVVMGDHSAAEMQRFMLTSLDRRLRTANPKVFEDPRNVDAALIYAMSGGNPATLEYLVTRDVSGYFDNRVSDVLRKYLAGRGLLAAKTLVEMVPEYQDKRIGPYLALVAGNVMVAKEPKEALRLYALARLTLPGTIVEEAALRRSVAIAVEAGMAKEGLAYARQYARRFIHSPYASQFADLFVRLAVEHYGAVTADDVDGALEVMSDDRAQEIYLRIARQATIQGKTELAALAARRAKERGENAPALARQAARLFADVADLSSGKVNQAAQAIDAVEESQLSPGDRALRAAARRVAEQVLRAPTQDGVEKDSLRQDSLRQDSLRQDRPSTIPNQISAEQTSALPGQDVPGAHGAAGSPAIDPTIQTILEKGRSSLSAIDELLNKDK
ncbi:chemotaxis protein MotC [Rhizobium sp. SSA_523]|uniref:chemotaxis protein MotC n=1 Tax=Rhizobium sp. SSA_523 TaxID=2952477 RepID=UPI002091DB04|nr:chemotaxis protein MotC [Rhizobium sp. SSA_523]MCO5733030.1 chemotaxis protein MotC [Rhizobium sp. SSA_523]WKC23911.1 chemotaxis protein MotC [Rhizobium sp. SSA_523]